MDDDFWMTRALLLANKALLLNELPVGSILVYDNFELSGSINSCYVSSFNHSEVNLISRSCFYFSDNYFYKSTLYVTLEPCFICLSILSSYNIERIVFGAYSHKLLYNLYNNIKVTGGVLENESIFLLKAFFFNKRIC